MWHWHKPNATIHIQINCHNFFGFNLLASWPNLRSVLSNLVPLFVSCNHSLGVHPVAPVGEDGLVVVPELVDDGSVRLLVLVGQVRLGLGGHASHGLKQNTLSQFIT